MAVQLYLEYESLIQKLNQDPSDVTYFAALIDLEAGFIYNFSRRLVHQSGLDENCISDLCSKVSEKLFFLWQDGETGAGKSLWEKFPCHGDFRRYVSRIIWNALIDELRRRKRFWFFDDLDTRTELLVDHTEKRRLNAMLNQDIIEKALARLRKDQTHLRCVSMIEMRFSFEMKSAEIGEVVGLTPGHVRAILSDNYQTIRQKASDILSEYKS